MSCARYASRAIESALAARPPHVHRDPARARSGIAGDDHVHQLDDVDEHPADGTQGWFTAQCAFNFCGSQMPLTPETRDAIRQWITAGALNDCP
jgi:hypothetical protein